MLPLASEVKQMSRPIDCGARAPPAPSKRRANKDTLDSCRERASADLLKSVTMLTANERRILERSAASWTLRADMLEGLQRSAAEKWACQAQTAHLTRKD